MDRLFLSHALSNESKDLQLTLNHVTPLYTSCGADKCRVKESQDQ